MSNPEPISIAFVCVQNAGRSQMAYAFAEQERDKRGLQDRIELITGGTNPADRVHPVVVEVMEDVGIDLTDRTPRDVTLKELRDSDHVITMGCSATDVCPASRAGEHREWSLADPHGLPLEEVSEIRDDIRRRVRDLFDELVHPSSTFES